MLLPSYLRIAAVPAFLLSLPNSERARPGLPAVEWDTAANAVVVISIAARIAWARSLAGRSYISPPPTPRPRITPASDSTPLGMWGPYLADAYNASEVSLRWRQPLPPRLYTLPPTPSPSFPPAPIPKYFILPTCPASPPKQPTPYIFQHPICALDDFPDLSASPIAKTCPVPFVFRYGIISAMLNLLLAKLAWTVAMRTSRTSATVHAPISATPSRLEDFGVQGVRTVLAPLSRSSDPDEIEVPTSLAVDELAMLEQDGSGSEIAAAVEDDDVGKIRVTSLGVNEQITSDMDGGAEESQYEHQTRVLRVCPAVVPACSGEPETPVIDSSPLDPGAVRNRNTEYLGESADDGPDDDDDEAEAMARFDEVFDHLMESLDRYLETARQCPWALEIVGQFLNGVTAKEDRHLPTPADATVDAVPGHAGASALVDAVVAADTGANGVSGLTDLQSQIRPPRVRSIIKIDSTSPDADIASVPKSVDVSTPTLLERLHSPMTHALCMRPSACSSFSLPSLHIRLLTDLISLVGGGFGKEGAPFPDLPPAGLCGSHVAGGRAEPGLSGGYYSSPGGTLQCRLETPDWLPQDDDVIREPLSHFADSRGYRFPLQNGKTRTLRLCDPQSGFASIDDLELLASDPGINTLGLNTLA
ncbi:hypothetical protein LshimejAT787_1601520 [Lyophyllum shimeji]|uniref:Uncharacterized protein n=1 Tax=Lyophyllum shimeji TaxID=47721 RepID=A0A9P3PZQ8_LYOSH|nr:hypothetical protein LshimejAT787_1601520 [Lyophyllum shimeji]